MFLSWDLTRYVYVCVCMYIRSMQYHFNSFVSLQFLQLVMIEERRWPLGNKTTELHGGGGLITTVKWKDTLIAWANAVAKVCVVEDMRRCARLYFI